MLLLLIGFGISLLLLGVLLSKIDGRQLLHALAELDWRYLLGAVGLTFVSYWLRAVRWRLLLLHERPIALGSLYAATIIGYMANNLFPARLGEIVRVWLLARRERLKVTPVFASLVIDRMLDGFALMVMLAVVLLTLQLPPGMERVAALLRAGGVTTLVVYIGAVSFLLFLKLRSMQALKLLALLTQPFPQSFRERLIPLAGSFLEGLRLAPGLSNLVLIFVCTALIWISATLPIHLVLRGFDIQLPLSASFFIMVLLVFAVMVPSAPGYVGTYHVACYTGLAAFRLPDSQAVSIALVIHGVGFFPVIMAGLYHLWSGGLSLRSLRSQVTEQGAEP
jgi:hypothetical protein